MEPTLSFTRQEVAEALDLTTLDRAITQTTEGWVYKTSHQQVGGNGKLTGRLDKATVGPCATEAELLVAIVKHWHKYLTDAKERLAPGQADSLAYRSIDWRIKGAKWLLAGKPEPKFVPPKDKTKDKIPGIPMPEVPGQ
jgi:hypothetical protein